MTDFRLPLIQCVAVMAKQDDGPRHQRNAGDERRADEGVGEPMQIISEHRFEQPVEREPCRPSRLEGEGSCHRHRFHSISTCCARS